MDPRSDGLPPKDSWRTPLSVYQRIKEFFGIEFDLDPCTTPDNPLGTPYFFTREEDGLVRRWFNHSVKTAFVNPPYTPYRLLEKWIAKAYCETNAEGTKAVLLLPNSTDTRYFRDYLSFGKVYFNTGRVNFVGAPDQPRHGNIIVLFDSEKERSVNFLDLGEAPI